MVLLLTVLCLCHLNRASSGHEEGVLPNTNTPARLAVASPDTHRSPVIDGTHQHDLPQGYQTPQLTAQASPTPVLTVVTAETSPAPVS